MFPSGARGPAGATELRSASTVAPTPARGPMLRQLGSALRRTASAAGEPRAFSRGAVAAMARVAKAVDSVNGAADPSLDAKASPRPAPPRCAPFPPPPPLIFTPPRSPRCRLAPWIRR